MGIELSWCMNKPRIRIWETNSLGLILIRETGVIIQNQTGGVACIQSEIEGIYVPLWSDAHEIEDFFAESSGCLNGLNQAQADFLEEFLHRDGHKGLSFLRIDRTRLEQSLEAWVYVKVTEPDGDPRINLVEGFGETNGILTWSNSD
jgi:hypothetical protein